MYDHSVHCTFMETVNMCFLAKATRGKWRLDVFSHWILAHCYQRRAALFLKDEESLCRRQRVMSCLYVNFVGRWTIMPPLAYYCVEKVKDHVWWCRHLGIWIYALDAIIHRAIGLGLGWSWRGGLAKRAQGQLGLDSTKIIWENLTWGF